jgi:diaminohydroxyphosphoribosylaminopyrimidine deaminase/5-amino-6-(5-phosphoribosylamino)uracil reductase
MFEAFLEAMKAVGRPNPNPAVGCVIVRDSDQTVVARGYTQQYRGPHAERVAFDSWQSTLAGATQAGASLRDCTAYVTLEPCAHTGHQPPCAEMLAQSELARVVVGLQDPNHLVNGAGIARLRSAGKEVVLTSDFVAELKAWHLPFLIDKKRKRPAIFAKWAQTLDGQLCDDMDRSQWISGPQARAYTHCLHGCGPRAASRKPMMCVLNGPPCCHPRR